jgi:DNA-binding response OmpR family regulator
MAVDKAVADKPTILIVENDPLQRDLINLALSRIDCEVITVQDGQDALIWFENIQPELILLDLFLPQMSGLDIIARLKEDGKLHRTTVIAISALGFPEVVEQAQEAGAYDFLVKPIDSELLIRRVKKALIRRQ